MGADAADRGAGGARGLGFDGAVAVVTGGANGIGRACTLALAREGVSVVSLDVDAEGLAELRDRARHLAGRVVTLGGDASDEDDLRRAAGAADELGGLDIAVVNAGAPNSLVRSSAAVGRTVDLEPEAWSRVMVATTLPAFLGCKVFARQMMERGKPGVIINLGASLGLRAAPHNAAFAAAKAGVHQLTQTLAFELASHGIRVNCVAPLFVDTPGSREAVTEGRRALSAAAIPLGRIARPDDIAGAVLYLASELSSFVTGQTLLVDGGLFSTTLRPPRGWVPSPAYLEGLAQLRGQVQADG